MRTSGEEKLKLAVLYLLYPQGTGYSRERPLATLRKMLGRLNAWQQLVIIDNSASHEYERRVDDLTYEISGDNSSREFSGWQRGLEYLREQNQQFDACLFVNDTFLHRSWSERFALRQSLLEVATSRPCMLGSEMFAPPGEILGNPLHNYIRTHLFLMSGRVVGHLGNLATLDPALQDRIFNRVYSPGKGLFREHAPVSRELQEFIFSHLTARWRHQLEFSAGNYEALRGKAISVLNSFLLSMRVAEAGFPLVSMQRTIWPWACFVKNPIEVAGGKGGCDRVSDCQSRNSLWDSGRLRYQQLPGRKTLGNLYNMVTLLSGRRVDTDHL